MSRSRPLPERFWEKVDRRGPDDCWPWRASTGSHGYGQIALGGGAGPVLAHRVSWELANDLLIPEGYVIDHTCHNRDESCPGGEVCPHHRCVNPAHLDCVRPAVNARRGKSPAGVNWRSTRCRNGHEFDIFVQRASGRWSRRCSLCEASTRRARRGSQPGTSWSTRSVVPPPLYVAMTGRGGPSGSGR